MGERLVNDIIVLTVPPELIPAHFDGMRLVDLDQEVELARELDRAANEGVQVRQDRPPGIEFSKVFWQQWTLTNNPDVVAATPPPHDCDECREGLRLGVEALRAHPGIVVAVGHLRYMARGL